MNRPKIISTEKGVVPCHYPTPWDVMREDNDTNHGTPEDYYYHLALDTLQVYVEGYWSDAERWLQDLRLGRSWTAFDGTEFEVSFSAASRCFYNVLLRTPSNDHIQAFTFASGNPPLVFRFTSWWCLTRSLWETEQWIITLCASIGLTVLAIRLSEVHLRCDVPTPFVEHDRRAIRGFCLRGGGEIEVTYLASGAIKEMKSRNRDKPFTFDIYNKRHWEERRAHSHWPLVWSAFAIVATIPVWRVEGRFDRKKLLAFDLDHLADLTPEAMHRLWAWFTQRYLIIVSDPSKRTDRTHPKRKWMRIQEVYRLASPLSNEQILTAVRISKTI